MCLLCGDAFSEALFPVVVTLAVVLPVEISSRLKGFFRRNGCC